MARKKIDTAPTKTARVTEATVTLMGEFEELRKRVDKARVPPSLRRALEDSGVQTTRGLAPEHATAPQILEASVRLARAVLDEARGDGEIDALDRLEHNTRQRLRYLDKGWMFVLVTVRHGSLQRFLDEVSSDGCYIALVDEASVSAAVKDAGAARNPHFLCAALCSAHGLRQMVAHSMVAEGKGFHLKTPWYSSIEEAHKELRAHVSPHVDPLAALRTSSLDAERPMRDPSRDALRPLADLLTFVLRERAAREEIAEKLAAPPAAPGFSPTILPGTSPGPAPAPQPAREWPLGVAAYGGPPAIFSDGSLSPRADSSATIETTLLTAQAEYARAPVEGQSPRAMPLLDPLEPRLSTPSATRDALEAPPVIAALGDALSKGPKPDAE